MLKKKTTITKYEVLGQEISREQAIELLRDLVEEFGVLREPPTFEKAIEKQGWRIPRTSLEAEVYAESTREHGGEIMLEQLKKQLAELK